MDQCELIVPDWQVGMIVLLCGLPLYTNRKLMPKLRKCVEPGDASARQYVSNIAKLI